ncbi:hypothetical protein Ga0100230_002030 [Opitutaceae bacterium TAV3]|nr:hypothetical protein Ga0100230_002030 [Opitutaceae bacterium TAV3]
MKHWHRLGMVFHTLHPVIDGAIWCNQSSSMKIHTHSGGILPPPKPIISVIVTLIMVFSSLTQAAASPPASADVKITSIAASNGYSLFLRSDGTAWAVGNNTFGQLGDGTTTDRLTPVKVMSGVQAIAAGEPAFFADAWAVGKMLLVITTTDRLTPVKVTSHSLFLGTTT